jgi:hypothetical protein
MANKRDLIDRRTKASVELSFRIQLIREGEMVV